MFRKGLGLLFLLLALGVFGLGGLLAWRQHAGGKLPSLPEGVDSSLDRVEKGMRTEPIGGIPAEYLASGAFLVLVVLAWFLLRRPAPPAPPQGERRRAEPPSRSNARIWALALIVLGLCGGGIVALYYGPDTITITESIKIQRGPRAEFLDKLKWGGILIGSVHVVYFAVIFLAKVFGGSRQPSRGRSSR